MEIEILNNSDTFTPEVGERTSELVPRIGSKMSAGERDTLISETVKILGFCSNPHLKQNQSITNLVVGYVQSGKTMSFTTLSALASDNGFRVIIYLAGTKNKAYRSFRVLKSL